MPTQKNPTKEKSEKSNISVMLNKPDGALSNTAEDFDIEKCKEMVLQWPNFVERQRSEEQNKVERVMKSALVLARFCGTVVRLGFWVCGTALLIAIFMISFRNILNLEFTIMGIIQVTGTIFAVFITIPLLAIGAFIIHESTLASGRGFRGLWRMALRR